MYISILIYDRLLEMGCVPSKSRKSTFINTYLTTAPVLPIHNNNNNFSGHLTIRQYWSSDKQITLDQQAMQKIKDVSRELGI